MDAVSAVSAKALPRGTITGLMVPLEEVRFTSLAMDWFLSDPKLFANCTLTGTVDRPSAGTLAPLTAN